MIHGIFMISDISLAGPTPRFPTADLVSGFQSDLRSYLFLTVFLKWFLETSKENATNTMKE